MKTNLTTKQIKKIQNGKLAIHKDIDTADAREYLLLFLNCKFPNDKSTEKGKTICIKENKIFIGFGDGRWGFDRLEDNSLPTVPLSQIMYTYNPEQFEAISMPCTEEQWNNDLKPVVEAFGYKIEVSEKDYVELTNDYNQERRIRRSTVCDTYKERKRLKTYSPTEFLEACGIVRVNKEEKVCFADAIKVFSGNTRSKSFSSELFKEYMVYPITTDQIKTARTNPETLEKLFPKVFEKPVVEVGKWLRIDNLDDNTKGFCYLDADGYSYGFSKSGKWLEKLKRPIDKPNYREKITEATLSDLQPLFEAEFNKRYKEGDLLENVDDSDKSNFKASDIMYHLFNGHPQICSNCISIFYNGNFAKVIKSAELIKAEEELEQAKKKVESLKNK